MEANLGANPRYIWHSILEAKQVRCAGSRIQIGDGKNKNIWGDTWLPSAKNGLISSSIQRSLEEAKVCGLMKVNERVWDLDVIRDLLSEEDVKKIQQIPLSHRDISDIWFWIHDSRGVFTIKSCYRQLQSLSVHGNRQFWRKFWYLKVPPKVLHFLLRAYYECILTAVILRTRRVDVNPICAWCKEAVETIQHVLSDCILARESWTLTQLNVGSPGSGSILEWIASFFAVNNLESCALFEVTSWQLWQQRNNWV